METKELTKIPEKKYEGDALGFIMIKSQAFERGIVDPVIEDLIVNPNKYQKKINFDQELVPDLEKLRIRGRFIRTLDPERAVEVFYPEDKHKDYYPEIKDMLSEGQVMFFLVSHPSSQTELTQLLRQLKPTLRQVLAPGIEYRKFEELPENLPPEEKSTLLKQMMQNAIHTSDSAEEVAKAAREWLTKDDLNEMEDRGVKIRQFINYFDPEN